MTNLITLYACGEGFGLPEVSPYVTKSEIQLQMAGVPYVKVQGWREDSPKGQLPYIEDAGQKIADSTFIRGHVEARYGVDLDAGLDTVQRAQAWAIERMCENHLAWTSGHFRFLLPENFEKGPAHWFDGAPETARPVLRAQLLEAVSANIRAVGVGRHSEHEILALAARSLMALDALLGDKPFMMGEEPTSVDAIVFAVLAGMLTPFFDSPLRRRTERFPRLVAYTARMMARFYPDFAWAEADEAIAA
ncbi:glutathione S-transferase family protein [Phenylobacterium sp.]|uniref:glutathione S-transferase family protein n=1 Tax=Phenylobacterium sp. TaxID=1871053 RepID=UPI00271D01CC|nr:glutathione S-transferase family protein [Phenylobacterium sp.]MDO8379421.1 glutathione S-transferase family protein [Phenylobacterium sp.]